MSRNFMLVSLLMATPLFAQQFDALDHSVRNYPRFSAPEVLAIRIQNDFRLDEERIRAAFIWVTHNLRYEDTDYNLEKQRITYKSEEEKESAIRNLVKDRINHAFQRGKGVCVDYSLLLNYLFESFGLPSKVIVGIAKSEVRDIATEKRFRNHSWNAVQVYGQWKLMDATWAAGHVDRASRQFVRMYRDHYFFTDPADFIRNHYPDRDEWQLLEKPVDAAAFFDAPIFLPEFFEEDIALSPNTRGVLSVSKESENYIFFDKLPREHMMHYTINGSGEFRRMGFRKWKDNSYVSKIRLRKRFNRKYDYLTVFLNTTPILNFKLKEETR